MKFFAYLLNFAALASVGYAQLIKLRISSTTVPELNNKYLSSNGTHVGLFTDGSQSSATVFNAATAPGDRHWTLQNTGNDHFGAVVGPSDRSLLIFRDLANPQITPPDGTLIEWNLWRLMPAPDFRLRVADMSGNQWIAISGSIIGWASINTVPPNSTASFDIKWEDV